MREILKRCQNHYNSNLPFVIYRKPNQNTFSGFFQNNDVLYATSSYQTEGFVFAPFDSDLPTYIIPKSKSDFFEEEINLKSHLVKNLNSVFVNHSEKEKSDHIALVQKGIDAINKDVFKKVVLTRKEEVVITIQNPLDTFLSIASQYPEAFVYYWFHPKETTWMGASPESLVKTKGKLFETMALAGTQSFLGSLEVEWDNKEKLEHQFVVDYLVSQLQKQMDLTNLKVSEAYTKKAGSLLHLRTDLKGEVDELNLKKLIEALHPTPAVCGLPKKEAKLFIMENERYLREFYTGFLGELNKDQSEFFVNLRCMKVCKNTIQIFVGGGIVADSIPDKEWKETVLKSGIMKKII